MTSRNGSFSQGHSDWRPPASTAPTHDEPFDLPPEQEAYYDGLDEAAKHQEKMAGMSVAERNRYTRGLREGLSPTDKNGVPTPKRGDFNNPLKRDMPKDPAPPRAPRQRSVMSTIRQLDKLSRMAKGKRR